MRDVESLPENFSENLHKTIGKNVKRERERKGLSQLQLSQMIGHKSVSIVSRAEIHYKNQRFNIEHLVKIAYVLQIDLNDLVAFDSETQQII